MGCGRLDLRRNTFGLTLEYEEQIGQWIGEKGPGLFHICFEVEIGGARIAFIDPSATGNVLIELAELPPGH